MLEVQSQAQIVFDVAADHGFGLQINNSVSLVSCEAKLAKIKMQACACCSQTCQPTPRWAFLKPLADAPTLELGMQNLANEAEIGGAKY